MKRAPKLLAGCLLAAAALLPAEAPAATAKQARVTKVIRDVKLVPSDAEVRPAEVNDQVREGIAVRTGDQSRSELTFPDVTISRLGANTIFTFNQAGHSVDISGGSVLLRVPKNSGGGNIKTSAVSVAITGTTVILESSRTGRSKLFVLEGGARLALVKNRGQSRDVRAGQMLDVPAGATTLPVPQNIDLNQLMKTHPLITDFPPLPSRDLILAAARNPPPGPSDEPVYPGQPVSGPVAGPAITIGPSFPGLPFPGGFPGGFPGQRDPNRPQRPDRPGRPSSPPATPGPNYPPTTKPTPQPQDYPPTKKPNLPPVQSTLPPLKRIPPRPQPTPTPPVIR